MPVGNSLTQRRETLHDFTLEVIRAIAETFGCHVEVNLGQRPGPDIIIRYPRDTPKLSIYIESEVGHDTGGAPKYFDNLIKRLKKYISEDLQKKRSKFIMIITNTPRRLRNYIREKSNRQAIAKELGVEDIIEGVDIFIIPAILYREILPSLLCRILSSYVRGQLIVT